MDFLADSYPVSHEWEPFFEDNRQELEGILKSVQEDEKMFENPVFPYKEDIFRFTKIPPDKVSAVILGMEPYMSAIKTFDGRLIPEATGRSFEVRNVLFWDQAIKQASLRNILKALYVEYNRGFSVQTDIESIREDIRAGEFPIKPPALWFNEMELQGVMFLNAALTVAPQMPGYHLRLWKPFILKVLEYIADNSRNTRFLLFGKDAKDMAEDMLLDKKAIVVTTCHPRLSRFCMEDPFLEIRDELSHGFSS